MFYQKVSGTRDIYHVADIEGQLRNTIVGAHDRHFRAKHRSVPRHGGEPGALGQKIAESVKPMFAELGLSLESFVVENLSLPDELQKMLDQRISMNMMGDMGKYTQFQVAQSLPIAAANEGGGGIAGIGVGLGAGLTMAQSVMNAMKPGRTSPRLAEPAPSADPSRRSLPLRQLPRPSSASTAASRFRALRNSVRSAARPSNNRNDGTCPASNGSSRRTAATPRR